LNIPYIAMPLLFVECKEVVKGRLRDEYKVMLEKVTEAYSERELGLWGRIDQGDLWGSVLCLPSIMISLGKDIG
jgi:hypothetical protein